MLRSPKRLREKIKIIITFPVTLFTLATGLFKVLTLQTFEVIEDEVMGGGI